MSEPVLSQLIADLAGGRIRIVDLTQTLSPDFPQIVLPPEMGQAWPRRIEGDARHAAERARLVLDQLFLHRPHRHPFRRADPLDFRPTSARQLDRYDSGEQLHRSGL